MKPWILLTLMILSLLLAQGQRIFSAPGEGPTPQPGEPDDSPQEFSDSSAIHAPLIPGNFPGILGCPSFSSDGKLIAAQDSQGIKVFDTRTGRPTVLFDAKLRGPVFSPRGNVLAASFTPNEWALFETTSGGMIRRMAPLPGLTARNGCSAVTFSPDGKWLAAAYDTGEVVVWDVASGRRHRVLPPLILPGWRRGPMIPGGTETVVPDRPDQVKTLAFSPDGATLYAAGWKVRAWDIAGTAEPRRFDFPKDVGGELLAISPDGATVAVGDGGPETLNEVKRSILLFDAATGRRKAEITMVSAKTIQSLAFRPGGRELVTLDDFRNIRLWDVATAKQIASCRFDKHFRLDQLAVSPDGHHIAAAGYESDAIFGVIGMVETIGPTLGPWRPAP